jgi:hypothetical protein
MKQKATSLVYKLVKSFLIMITPLLLITATVIAQAPIIIGEGKIITVAGNGANDSGPLYRGALGAANTQKYSRYHYLYTAAELATAGIIPGSVITQLSWNKNNAAAFTGPASFEIWIKNSARNSIQAAPQTWSTLITGSTQVYNTTTLLIGANPGFVNFGFSTPFVYTGGALEISVAYDHSSTSSPWATSGIAWVRDTITGRTISNNGATASMNLNLTRNARPQLKITYNNGIPCTTPPIAGTPVSTGCSIYPFSIRLVGAQLGAGVTYQWQQSTIDSIGPYTDMTNDTNQEVVTTISTATWYRCMVTCSGVSTYSSALKKTLGLPLAGTYTINPALPISATNYHSIATIADDLSCGGVSAPVTINVALNSGPYTSNVSFGQIPGSSATNTITINGNGNTISSAITPIITFAGSSYITLDSFNIIGTASFGGFGIHIGSQSHHLILNRNKIDVGTTTPSAINSHCGIVASDNINSPFIVGNNAKYLTITNNEVIGGTIGLILVGNPGFLDNYGHIIRGNRFSNHYSTAIQLENADTTIVDHNDISGIYRTSITATIGIRLNSCRYTKVTGNKIHDFVAGSYNGYAINTTGCISSFGFETEITNNLIYNIRAGLNFYGITATSGMGFNIYHNTIQHEVSINNTGTYIGAINLDNPYYFNVKNNIISITGTTIAPVYGFNVIGTDSSFISNNNVIDINTSSASNNIGYWNGMNRVTLGDWQTATARDVSSVSSSPIFANISQGSLIPLSFSCDNIGAPIAAITSDITGALRSTTTPDPGAYEFMSVANDIAITKGELKYNSVCYSFADTLNITIKNVIGTPVNFAANPLKVVWKVTGPVTTIDSFIVNSGTLATNASQVLTGYNVDMSQAGTYKLYVYIEANPVNLSQYNDTFIAATFTVKPILSVTPKYITVTGANDTVVLTARSALFPGTFIISEICHQKSALVGSPSAGWPAYIPDDYIEITGAPGYDLGGYTLEQWDTTTLLSTHTFPGGTILSPNGTAIIGVGSIGASVSSSTDFYYLGNGSYTGTFNANNTPTGRILKAPSGIIMDAVGYGGDSVFCSYTFPVAAGVSAADWSGRCPISSATCGIRLVGPDMNDTSNWRVSNNATLRQNPNGSNSGIVIPVQPSAPGLNWSYLSTSLGSLPNITVGPYTVPGLYKYVASYTNTCGTFYDTAYVTASATVPVKLTIFTATKSDNDVKLNWQTASETNNDHFVIERSVNGFDFTAIGLRKGMGNKSTTSRYIYTDINVISKLNTPSLYYRLKQVDNDGKTTYSSTEVVHLSNKKAAITIYPNPTRGDLTIITDIVSSHMAKIKVMNLMGTTVWTQSYQPLTVTNSIDVQLQLPDGIYLLLLEQDKETSIHKLIIQN